MVKKLFEVYVTYGKDSGEELRESWVAEDTPEERVKAMEDECGFADDWDKDTAEFERGQIDFIGFSSYGDWDDPTGGYLQVRSYEEQRAALADNYEQAVQQLNDLFHFGA